MSNVLYSWIGAADIKLARAGQAGALAATLIEARLDLRGAVLLRDPTAGSDLFDPASLDAYVTWLRQRTGVPVDFHDVPLEQPMHFGQIYAGVRKVLEETLTEETQPTFNLSSGTPAMTAVWILVGRGPHRARLTNSSVEAGVVEAIVPFDVFTEFLPDALRASDRVLADLGAGRASGAFGDIVYRSKAMEALIARAGRVAEREVPVLILGESGTGKELFARGMHDASPRAGKAMHLRNCGAIPKDLVESTLFGHVRGAFTGADKDHVGAFEAANGSTLFLDEIGELPLSAQSKLLRVLERGEVQPVGAQNTRRVDVRVVAATHRDLARMVADGTFREDLYYRLAVAILRIPALRERKADLQVMIDTLLEQINEKAAGRPGYQRRRLSNGARKKLTEHDWPGNVRELQNTLVRATIWSTGTTIEADDVELLSVPKASGDGILERPLGDGLQVKELVDDVRRHYLLRALRETRGRKVEAGELIGIGRQSVTDWMRQLGIESGDAE